MNKTNILKIIFFIGLFLSPLIYYPYALIPYEIPKVVFIKYWIEILLVLGILFFKKEQLLKIKNWTVYFVLTFVVIAIVTSFTGSNINKSWIGNYYRGDGLFMFLHFIGLSIFILIYAKKDWLGIFLKTVGITGIVLALLSVGEWVLINIFGLYDLTTWIDDGIGLSFGNPNFLVGYLLLSLPGTLYLFENSRLFSNRVIRILIWMILFFAIIFTKAWTGIFGVGLFLLLTYFSRKGITKSKVVNIPVIITLVIILVAFLQTNFSSNVFGNLSGIKLEDKNGILVAESRSRIYAKGVLAFTKEPFLGYGWANFDHAFESIYWPIRYENDVYVDKAHMTFLEILVTTGIFGFALYILITFKTLVSYWWNRKKVGYQFLILFLILVIHMQTNVVSVSEELVFWLMVGFGGSTWD